MRCCWVQYRMMLVVCVGILAVIAPSIVDAADAPAVNFVELTPPLRAAIERGQVYLAKVQEADGNFGDTRYGKHVGITALGCLALMADGHVPGRGKYGHVVQKGLDFVLSSSQETGLIAKDTSHGPMYGHGFATLFLGEIYGMTSDRRVREALVKATRLIINSQNEEGGWRYRPEPADADLSVTICQVMALRSAREAGIHVPKKTIDRAVEYVKKSQVADGGFKYMMHSGGSAFPRSAAGVATFYYAGVYEGDAIKRGLNYLMAYQREMSNRTFGHYFYGQYYAVQAMYLAGGNYWRQWYPAIRKELLNRQDDTDGSWDSTHGKSYGTAMAMIILQVPHRYLPVLQR
jgi:hypothetical protein